jgi:hypothetical protein
MPRSAGHARDDASRQNGALAFSSIASISGIRSEFHQSLIRSIRCASFAPITPMILCDDRH